MEFSEEYEYYLRSFGFERKYCQNYCGDVAKYCQF